MSAVPRADTHDAVVGVELLEGQVEDEDGPALLH